MPTPTYEPIQTTTLVSSQASVTLGSGGTIPQTYTDLVLVINATNSSGISNAGFVVELNGDTGSNYSRTFLYGDGTSAVSGRESNFANGLNILGFDSTTRGTMIVQFMNYSNASIFKTALSRFNLTSNVVATMVGLWRSTSAINTMKIDNTAGRNIAAGSTFTLYGIKAA